MTCHILIKKELQVQKKTVTRIVKRLSKTSIKCPFKVDKNIIKSYIRFNSNAFETVRQHKTS